LFEDSMSNVDESANESESLGEDPIVWRWKHIKVLHFKCLGVHFFIV
jgi:hypothetical protein